ncbi:hypothetical protein D3C76_1036430 [compost metagenome]
MSLLKVILPTLSYCTDCAACPTTVAELRRLRLSYWKVSLKLLRVSVRLCRLPASLNR